MHALGRKKTHVFFGIALPKSNARAHLKQRKKHSGLMSQVLIMKGPHYGRMCYKLRLFHSYECKSSGLHPIRNTLLLIMQISLFFWIYYVSHRLI